MLKEEFVNDTTKMLEKLYNRTERTLLMLMDDDMLDERTWMYFLGKLSGILDVIRRYGRLDYTTPIEERKAYDDWYKSYILKYYGMLKYKEIQYDDLKQYDDLLDGGDLDV